MKEDLESHHRQESFVDQGRVRPLIFFNATRVGANQQHGPSGILITPILETAAKNEDTYSSHDAIMAAAYAFPSLKSAAPEAKSPALKK